ncbi:hypothetical protein Back2_28620 [Nocardioides baekrokdamisoli]|uniref:Uncharacterized protein n=1 Tax=Nocardioides baekrokdamisoli TaxID=1804624 RepID=A0A3G9IRI0_9ACTN|nr:hypothetical protein Back2_28620 [Nocardioides baekrokdamisoli]
MSWAYIDDRFAKFADDHPEFAHMSAIVKSVRAVGADADLAACTSMHDLIVVAEPIPEPPYDVVAIRAPSSLAHPSNGSVLIEHLSITGRDDRLERPVDEAVLLFWRFMIEKFGVDPSNYSHPQ